MFESRGRFPFSFFASDLCILKENFSSIISESSITSYSWFSELTPSWFKFTSILTFTRLGSFVMGVETGLRPGVRKISCLKLICFSFKLFLDKLLCFDLISVICKAEVISDLFLLGLAEVFVRPSNLHIISSVLQMILFI